MSYNPIITQIIIWNNPDEFIITISPDLVPVQISVIQDNNGKI